MSSFAASCVRFLQALHADRLVEPFYRGKGTIVAGHRVLPAADFPPLGFNEGLYSSAEFLDELIGCYRGKGYDLVSMDELYRRLESGDFSRPFVAFTFDDGYRDNLAVAGPVFHKHGAPFTIYVTSATYKRRMSWPYLLEDALAANEVLEYRLDGEDCRERCATYAEKRALFGRLWARLVEMQSIEALEEWFESVLASCRMSPEPYDGLFLDEDELRRLDADPLVTLGAHTAHHYNLARIEAERVEEEMAASKAYLEGLTREEVRHFAYPYGGPSQAGRREFDLARRCGFRTMVTTRTGHIFPQHGATPECLPRVSLHGSYETVRQFEFRANGFLQLRLNRGRRVAGGD